MVAKTHIALADGTFKSVRRIYVNDGTAWHTVKIQWVKDDGGTWRKVHVGFFVFNDTVATSRTNYNLRTELTNAGWDGTTDVQANVTINAGVSIYSTSTPVAAFIINPALPALSTVQINNNGNILGKGGNAGSGGPATARAEQVVVPSPVGPSVQLIATASAGPGSAGSSGGAALFTSSPVVLINKGLIASGGGGGGGGGGASASAVGLSKPAGGTAYGGGGGGGGAGSSGSPSALAAGGTTSTPTPAAIVISNGNAGNDGTDSAGAGGAGLTRSTIAPPSPTTPSTSVTSGAGGNGGARGSSGGSGGNGVGTYTPTPLYVGAGSGTAPGAAGGIAGVAINGISLVTQPPASTGTITGPTTN